MTATPPSHSTKDEFRRVLTPYFTSGPRAPGPPAEAALKTAVSVMCAFRALKALEQKEPTPPVEIIEVIADLIAVWPQDAVLYAQGGRMMHAVQSALSDWLEAVQHGVMFKEVDDPNGREGVEHKVRASVLRESPFSVVRDLAYMAAPDVPRDAQFPVRLRRDLERAMG